MRVISGSARGLKLVSPAGIDTRPTLDRVKEAVFSMILPYINDATVLDLFAGSGALGIESLSRGALSATFIDSSDDAILCIKKNVENARMTEASYIEKKDAINYLTDCNTAFDIIFLDPPYTKGFYAPVLKNIYENNLLNKDGIIVTEWDTEWGFADMPFGFECVKSKQYGRVGVTVLKRGLSE